MTERKDYAFMAEQDLSRAEFQSSTKYCNVYLQKAQVHATLALVEQQRIANVFTLQSGSVNATTDPAQDLVFEPDSAGDPVLRPGIRKALGLD